MGRKEMLDHILFTETSVPSSTLRNSAVLLGPEASQHIGREGEKDVFLSLSHWAFGDTLRWDGGAKLVSFKIFQTFMEEI